MKNTKILQIFKNNQRFWVAEEFNQTKPIDLVEKYDKKIMKDLFADNDYRKVFTVKTNTLQTASSNNVNKIVLLMTDELKRCKGIQYDRIQVNHSVKEYVNGMTHTNSIESVWSILKHSLFGKTITYKGLVS